MTIQKSQNKHLPMSWMLSFMFIASVLRCFNLNSGRLRIWEFVSNPLYRSDDLAMVAHNRMKYILTPFHVDCIFFISVLFSKQNYKNNNVIFSLPEDHLPMNHNLIMSQLEPLLMISIYIVQKIFDVLNRIIINNEVTF